MENKQNPSSDSVEEEPADDDTLSFRNFSTLDYNDANTYACAGADSPRISFEFVSISPGIESVFTKPDIIFCKDRSDSLRFLRSLKHYSLACNQVQKVNITSLTTMSAKSRRRMFMFGPVKFKPEMELCAIKERQGRRVPMYFPTVGVVEGGDTVAGGGGGKRNRWKMIKAFRGTAHLSNVFAKLCGCLPLFRRVPGN